MTDLVVQRTPNDCAIATIAMVTGRSYEEVFDAGISSKTFDPEKGLRTEALVLRQLGLLDEFDNGEPVGDFVCHHRPYPLSPEYFRVLAWGRRAILTVPSLNNQGGHHSVYYDGCDVFDPNPPEKKRYTEFRQLLPSEIILFREARQ